MSTRGALASALLLALPLAVASAEARAEEAPAAAPPAPEAGETQDRLPFLEKCVSAEERATAEAGKNQQAFGPRPVPLGPFYWATADRTLVQAMLLYWRVLDVEEGTKLSLVLPLYLNHCSPEAETRVGPVGMFGSRTDVEGTAGWWGPYFFRRDRQLSADVLFPLFWWMRDQENSTFVLGPGFHLQRGPKSFYGVAPLFFGVGDETDGSYFRAAPGYLAWGDKDTSRMWLLQTWAQNSPELSAVASVPFYFSWRNKIDQTWGQVIPPLLSVAWGDDRTLTAGRILGPYYSWRDGERLRRGVVPLWFSTRGAGGEHWDWAPLGATVVWGDDLEKNVLALQTYYRGTEGGWRLFSVPFFGAGADKNGDHFAIIPPLALAHLGTAQETRTWAGQTFVHRFDLDRNDGKSSFEIYSFPFYFGGKNAAGRYYDVVPFLFARWGSEQRDESNVLVGPNWYQRKGSQWTALAPPFYFGRSDEETGSYLHAAPLLLSAAWSDGKRPQKIIAGYYDLLTDTGAHTGLVPVYAQGTTTEGASSLFAYAFREGVLDPLLGDEEAKAWIPAEDFHYRVIPPLTYLHFGTDTKERTLVAQTFIASDEDSWDAWSVPFYFGGADRKGSYHIIPPLLFASAQSQRGGFTFMPGFYQDRRPDRTLTLVAQTRAEFGPNGWTLWSVPFYFGGGDHKGHYHLLPALASGEAYNKETGSYFRVVAPALHAAWKDHTGVTSILGPWIDSRKNNGDRFKAFVPLYAGTENDRGFFDMYSPFYFQWGRWAPGKNKLGERVPLTTRALLLPALAYYSSQPDSTLLVAPGVWHRSDHDSSDTVVFPGYFDIQRPGFSATMIAGGYWNFGWTDDKGAPRSLIVAPAYARWEDPDEVLHVAGPLAWSTGKGDKAQAWSFHAEPFVSLWSLHPQHFRWQVGLGAFGYEREYDKEQMTLFWVDTEPS